MSVSSMINGPEKRMPRSNWITWAKSTVPCTNRQVLIHGSVVVRELHLPNSLGKGSNKSADSPGKEVAMRHVESQAQVWRSDAAKELSELLHRHSEVLELRVRGQAVHVLDHQRHPLSLSILDSASKGLAQSLPHAFEIDAEVEPTVDNQVLAAQGHREINVLF